jgi:hypothetical protein
LGHISSALKQAAGALKYPTIKSILIKWVNTYSLQIGGANALALAGYLDTQNQKTGCWRGATFKEYVRNELAFFSSSNLDSSMSPAMHLVTSRMHVSMQSTRLLYPWR